MKINVTLRPNPPQPADQCKPNAAPDRPWTNAECHKHLAEVLEFISTQGVFAVTQVDTEAR